MRGSWSGVLLLSCACACAPRDPTFSCSTDSQCVDGPHQGACESTGYCSFPDLDCDSDRRYGPLAVNELAGTCVPIDDATGSTSSMPMSSSSSTSAMMSSSESTTPITEPPMSTSAESSESGSEPMPPPGCDDFVDEFEDGVIGNVWEVQDEPDCDVFETNGRVEFTLGAKEECRAGIEQVESSLLGVTLRAAFAPIEGPIDEDIVVWLSVGDPEVCSLEIGIAGDRIAGYSYLDFIDGGAADFTQPMWMQLRIDPDGFVNWEVLREGTWDSIYAGATECELSRATHQLWAGSNGGLERNAVRAVEEFRRCGP